MKSMRDGFDMRPLNRLLVHLYKWLQIDKNLLLVRQDFDPVIVNETLRPSFSWMEYLQIIFKIAHHYNFWFQHISHSDRIQQFPWGSFSYCCLALSVYVRIPETSLYMHKWFVCIPSRYFDVHHWSHSALNIAREVCCTVYVITCRSSLTCSSLCVMGSSTWQFPLQQLREKS